MMAVAVLLGVALASATVVERVVAIVGERAILLSDVRARSKPFLTQVFRQEMPSAQRNAAISQVYKATLKQMVDEELEQREAARARIVVTPQEVDNAVRLLASQNKLTVEQLVTEARTQGMSEAQYRAELRRQVLQQKMANLRLQGRVRVTEDDLRALHRRMVLEEREGLSFRAAELVLDIPVGASEKQVKALQELGRELSNRANRGEDFADLVAEYSTNPESRRLRGLLPTQVPSQLQPRLARIVMSLNVGETSPATRLGSRLYLIKLIERDDSQLPAYDSIVPQLRQRLMMEKMAVARRHWLDNLRRRVHVEIRL
jgi:peptidyl-prolyl cis-trans isomerase SurA